MINYFVWKWGGKSNTILIEHSKFDCKYLRQKKYRIEHALVWHTEQKRSCYINNK